VKLLTLASTVKALEWEWERKGDATWGARSPRFRASPHPRGLSKRNLYRLLPPQR